MSENTRSTLNQISRKVQFKCKAEIIPESRDLKMNDSMLLAFYIILEVLLIRLPSKISSFSSVVVFEFLCYNSYLLYFTEHLPLGLTVYVFKMKLIVFMFGCLGTAQDVIQRSCDRETCPTTVGRGLCCCILATMAYS